MDPASRVAYSNFPFPPVQRRGPRRSGGLWAEPSVASLRPLFFLILGVTLPAQQAIVNMPSADITPKGKHFLMHETQTRPWNPGRSWTGTNFYALGVGRETEIAVTSYNLGAALATGVGFKSAPGLWGKSHPELEAKFTFGQMAVFNHRGSGLGSFSYSHGSFRLPRARTRLSAGAWTATRQLIGRNSGGAMLGAEHPVGHRFTLVCEWLSGRHDFGYLVPGLTVHLPRNQALVAGYKVPNYVSSGKSGFVLEYGIVF